MCEGHDARVTMTKQREYQVSPRARRGRSFGIGLAFFRRHSGTDPAIRWEQVGCRKRLIWVQAPNPGGSHRPAVDVNVWHENFDTESPNFVFQLVKLCG